MKKQNFTKKLNFNKETISSLTNNDLLNAKGGRGTTATMSSFISCFTTVPCEKPRDDD